jgi:small subunit ribosomal protein S21
MAKLVSVKKRKNEPFQKMLKRFKRKVNDSEHLTELRERKHFVKPSLKKRKQKEEAIRELKRLTKEQKELWG